MKIKTLLFVLLLCTLLVNNSLPQEMPLVYDVENTGSDCPIPYLAPFNQLPSVEALPDPFQWSDGRGRISNFSDWRYRRAEIKAEIEHYEIGEKPAPPDTIEASYSDNTLTVIVTVNGKTLTLTSEVALPSGEGPFPAVIGMNSPSGSIPESLLTSRNIARITYRHDQVTSYSSPGITDPYYQLYPHLNLENTGQYSAWVWGISRLIDGLEIVQEDLPIDIKHLAVTGCSYAGKMAIFAGAFDERIALTIGIESGGGGYTTWRYSEEINKTESVETLGKTNYEWFRNSMSQFSNNVSKLPHDHHELMAMVAPRALFVTGNPGWTWLADESGHVGSNAAKEVWNALGVPDRFGYSLIGGHGHCTIPGEQIPEIEAFIDKFLLGDNTVNTDVATSPYNTNLSPWITWTTPTLSNDTSYFGKASPLYPANLQTSLDTTNITFEWNKLKDAEKYLIQLSTDATFNNIVKSDSTTDTVKTFSGFLEGRRYYWRIQAKNISGSSGPWSNTWNFSTYIPLPATPELISATLPFSSRSDYITLKWNKVVNASQYLAQLSIEPAFTSLFGSTSTSDTTKNINGIKEGQKYYWRVQAMNIEGAGPWSEVLDFTTILAPEDLTIQKSASNEITLNWEDKSRVEDGYIVERKKDPDTSFAVVDTLKGSGNEYVDSNLEQARTYTYRIKAYKDSSVSGYSNEASLILTDVEEEKKIPAEYSISQNYPNPFNPDTKIKFGLPNTALTKLVVYDILGKEIRVLVNKELEAGYHEINVDAKNLPSGVYLYRIQSGEFVHTKKMILMK